MKKVLRAAGLLALGAPLLGCSEGPCDPEAPNSICTIAGDGKQGFGRDNLPATQTSLYVPQDTAIGPDGRVWILDFNNYIVRELDDNGVLHIRVGNGEVGDDPDPGVVEMPAIDAAFNHTTNLFFNGGYLYVSAWHSSRIKRIDLSTMMIKNYAGLGRRTFYDGDGGPALDASLDLPSSIALDPAGNIVIMDQANQVIRRIDKTTGIIDTIVGTCVVDLAQPCAAGQVPQQCPGSNKLACGDLASQCAEACTPSYGGDGGPARLARMAQPFGQAADPAGRIVYDHAGNLIFADTDNNRIRKVDPAGIITTIAGTGAAGYSGDGGPAAAAKINRPIDVAIGDDNSVYFADMENNCIRKIDPFGTISTVVGICSHDPRDRAFAGDGGSPLEAKLDRPYGIDLQGKKLYVSDSYNNRIRLVNLP